MNYHGQFLIGEDCLSFFSSHFFASGITFSFQAATTGFDLLDYYLLSYRTFSFYFAFNISKEVDSTASLGNLLHCLTTHSKNLIHDFRWNFMSFNLCPFCFVLSLNTTDKSLLPSSSGWPVPALSSLSAWEMLQFFPHISSPSLKLLLVYRAKFFPFLLS